MITDYPNSVSRDQLREVCRILGLPASDVRSLTLDCLHGLDVEAFLSDEAGSLIQVGDGPAEVSVHIPILD